MKEILPPRVRFRWLLTTTRLSIINFAGMARTLVAVGMSSDVFMFSRRPLRTAQNLRFGIAVGGRPGLAQAWAQAWARALAWDPRSPLGRRGGGLRRRRCRGRRS